MRKFLKITGASLLGLSLLAWLIFRFGLDLRYPAAEVATYFEGQPAPISSTYPFEGRSLHYQHLGADSLPTVLFIHGSPGGWDNWISYFRDSTLRRHCRLIAVDRPGYGLSAAGGPLPALSDQARSLLPLVASLPDSVPLIVVGHSYGGPVAARLAMYLGPRADGLLLLAGVFDPAHEKRFWIQRPLQRLGWRWTMPPDLWTSNEEMIPLRAGLSEMASHWGEITAPTLIYQGGRDILVDPAHADFAERQLGDRVRRVIRRPSENHFVIWTDPQLVRDLIVELLPVPPTEVAEEGVPPAGRL